MNDDKNLFGCFASITQAPPNADQQTKDLAAEQGRLFRTYIWGEKGICDALKKLNHDDYGKDLKLALFQFHVNPMPIVEQTLKEIENYRKNERSIGIPIVVNSENFFNKGDGERYSFLQHAIFQKLDILAEVIKRKKLDTNIEAVKADLKEALSKRA